MTFGPNAHRVPTRILALLTALLFSLGPVPYLLAAPTPTPSPSKRSASSREKKKKPVKHSAKIIPEKKVPDVDTIQYPPLTIGPGDILTIAVLGFDPSVGGMASSGSSSSSSSLPSTYLVDSEGQIFFPYVGAVDLSGLSQIDASELLMKKLKHYLKFPQVTVEITTSNTYNASVIGDVARPGQFMIRGKPDILTMLSQAGGPGLDPDLGGVLLTRGTRKIHIDLGKLLNDRNYHEPAPTVYPGDVIYVPQSGWPSLRDIALFLGVVVTSVVLVDNVSKK